ncbi:MAG: Nitroreductase family protein [Syntrophaceae bacterium PtaB.Bin038]|nr:MAG: Nitroreductase family protein [Syntrophaceae bacterium PtaB.Bin038]
MEHDVPSRPPLPGLFLAAGLAVLVSLAHASPVRSAGTAAAGKEGALRVIPLPEPKQRGSVSLEEAMAKRVSVRDFRPRALTREEIAQILWAAGGQTRPWGGRTVPSAGALYPLEIDIVTPDGVFRYRPDRHRLEQRAAGNVISNLAAAAYGQRCVARAPAVVVLSAVYERTRARYGSRAERYVHMEAGHAAQNIHLAAVALGLGSVAVGAFHDDGVHRALGLSREERPLYLIPVGEPAAGP